MAAWSSRRRQPGTVPGEGRHEGSAHRTGRGAFPLELDGGRDSAGSNRRRCQRPADGCFRLVYHRHGCCRRQQDLLQLFCTVGCHSRPGNRPYRRPLPGATGDARNSLPHPRRTARLALPQAGAALAGAAGALRIRGACRQAAQRYRCPRNALSPYHCPAGNRSADNLRCRPVCRLLEQDGSLRPLYCAGSPRFCAAAVCPLAGRGPWQESRSSGRGVAYRGNRRHQRRG